jgi:hypothetical protein
MVSFDALNGGTTPCRGVMDKHSQEPAVKEQHTQDIQIVCVINNQQRYCLTAFNVL